MYKKIKTHVTKQKNVKRKQMEKKMKSRKKFPCTCTAKNKNEKFYLKNIKVLFQLVFEMKKKKIPLQKCILNKFEIEF